MATKIQFYIATIVLTTLVAGIRGAATRTQLTPHKDEGDVKETNRFTYLGSFVSAQSNGRLSKRNVGARATSFYFFSQNAAGHATAESDCKAFLGENATLLSIETLDELGNVTNKLRKSDNTASTFWTSGRYDTEKGAIGWDSGVALGPWAPWDEGQPSTQVSVTRVLLHYNGQVSLRTEFSTESFRYICELRSGLVEEEAEPCYNDNDLVIVVDSSGSISQSHYMVALEFTVRLALAWAENPQNRLSVVVYSSSAQTIISLGQQLSVSQLRDTIYKAPYLGGNTASDLGLAQALGEFQQNSRNVPKNMVFLTDGASNDAQKTAAVAKFLQNAGIRSFAVGIGSGINAQELLTIAGGNQDHVFNTDGFADLLKLLQPVSRTVCP